ncbi:MAG: DUF4062 domain-containing protein [Methanosarcina sp.]
MKIFLCSTAYDLEDFRASIVDRYDAKLGHGKHEIIHFEDAAFPARRGLNAHDQCIVAVNQADVFICIINRRYGGLYAGNNEFGSQDVSFSCTKDGKEKKENIKVDANKLSISWCELITAFNAGKFVITFARQRTLDEMATRRKNQNVENFQTVHVDDLRVFDLLDWITNQRKDNWIIPFTSIVDFTTKLDNWLEAADQSIVVPDVNIPFEIAKPITIITEGPSDAEIAREVINIIHPNAPVNIIPANGKRNLLNNVEQYAKAFKESSALIFLMDADTTLSEEIDEQKRQFKAKTDLITETEVYLVITKPEIEEWLVSGFGEDQLSFDKAIWKVKNEFRAGRKKELLRYLSEHLDNARELSDSLDFFVRIVTDLLSRCSKDNGE